MFNSNIQKKAKYKNNKLSFRSKLSKDFFLNKYLYLMILPAIAYYIIFHYLPMYGVIISFKNYVPIKGVWRSDWVGLEHFKNFFCSYYFWRILKNTILFSVYILIFEFPAPIFFALLLNEVKSRFFKNLVQTVSYMPYFISSIVICGIIQQFTNNGGWINMVYTYLTSSDGQPLLQKPELFRSIYIISEIWQNSGWESVIYIAALLSINYEQYEAAQIDGANRLKQLFYISIPGLLPTITIMFILRIGHLLNISCEKIILLYSPITYETADVISTFVYRKGIQQSDWSFSSAVGLFNSIISLVLLVSTNKICKKINNYSLW